MLIYKVKKSIIK